MIMSLLPSAICVGFIGLVLSPGWKGDAFASALAIIVAAILASLAAYSLGRLDGRNAQRDEQRELLLSLKHGSTSKVSRG